MSSPWRPDESSPSRQLKREQRSMLRNGNTPPRRETTEAPTRQLLEEFSRLLIDKDHTLQKRLDDQVAEQERSHKAALAQAAVEHDRIRQNAERARERVQLEIERERKRREAAEADALEKERDLKAAQDAEERRRARVQLEKQEQERQRAQTEERELRETENRLAEQRRNQEAEATRQQQAQEEENRRELERKAKEDAENAAQAKARSDQERLSETPKLAPPAPVQQAPQSAAPPQTTIQSQARPQTTHAGTTGLIAPAQEREQLHMRYIELHKNLKKMREFVIAESKKNPALKSRLGDWRREIVKCMGQLTVDKSMNRRPMSEISRILNEALKFSEPSVDVSTYLLSRPSPGGQIRLSGIFVYLLNIFSKSIISQFISEASVSSKAADPVGVAAVTIFANASFKVSGSIPLIDILLAKFHVACPVLWGIYGDQKTPAGRKRIGWWQEDGRWVSEQRHIERMTGLAAGYAALSLRDFSKSRNENPFPNTEYWHAMAHIVNTPAEQVQSTHFIVLKALVDGYVPRFIGFYGMAAVTALRFALVDFPNKAPGSVAAGQVRILPEVMKRDLRLTL